MSDQPVTHPSWWKLLLTAVGSLVVVSVFLGAFLMRLRRIARPSTETVQVFRGGKVKLNRVILQRPGQSLTRASFLGWSVVCAGKEVWAVLGTTQPEGQEQDPWVWFRVQNHPTTHRIRVDLRDCSVLAIPQ